MNREEVKSIMESILFISSEPVSVQQFSSLLEIGKKQVEDSLELLSGDYAGNRGIHLVKINNGYQFCTHRSNYYYVERFCSHASLKKLSDQALEVLSIVAYRQPVTKGEIELIRGVQSSGVLNTLIEKELVEVCGQLEKIGRPLLYGTTENFLKAFGFSSIEDLPDINDFENADLFKSLRE